MPDLRPPPLLDYAPKSVGTLPAAHFLLRTWQILNILAAAPLMFIGAVGTWVAVPSRNGFWNIYSIEDWIGFLCWIAAAPVFMAMPTVWAIRCGICARRLAAGDLAAAREAARLCSQALSLLAIIAVGAAYGMLKSFMHSRQGEALWWLLVLMALFVLSAAILYSKRLFASPTPSPDAPGPLTQSSSHPHTNKTDTPPAPPPHTVP